MNRITTKWCGIVCMLMLCTNLFAAGEFAEYYENLPFEMPVVNRPDIPDYSINIQNFGAIADGATLNTEAFAQAMKHLEQKGGGRLVVPAGIWLTGPIEFVNHVELHLERGALLLFSANLADYPLIESSFEGKSSARCMSPLYALNRTDIAITGHGAIDGNGQAWRPVKKGKTTANQWKALCQTGVVGKKGDIWYANERIREVSENPVWMQKAWTENNKENWEYVHDYLRPVLLSFIGCRNILLEDATFENSPAWNIHPLMCQNMIINNITVRNPWYAQNGDGLDLESCSNVLVLNSSFDVGDDAICIKSGKDKEGRERGMPTQRVIIDGCVVYHGHGGFVIGSEMSGGAKNIKVSNCLFNGTDVGLRFKSTRGRGGIVENIYIDHINMINIAGDGLIFDLYYGIKGAPEVKPVSEETPQFRKIYISHTTCQNAKRAIYFNGLPEMPIEDIEISDSRFHGISGAVLNYVNGITLKDVRIEAEKGEPISRHEVTRFSNQ